MSQRDVTVLGAGMVGVSIAWHLARRGHQVTLIDRCEPGQETSYGNAGVIQREAVAPYAMPRDLRTLVSILGNRRLDVRWHWRGLLAAASPLSSYFRHSATSRHEHITKAYATLVTACLDTHAEMIAASQSEHLVRESGYLEFFRHDKTLKAACSVAEGLARDFAIHPVSLDATAFRQAVPQFIDSSGSPSVAGAIHWQDAWTVMDPGDLVKRYAESFLKNGGQFLRDDIHALEAPPGNDRPWHLIGRESRHAAPCLVVATGPWSVDLLAPLGVRLPLFVKRGYHRHFRDEASTPLSLPVIDAEMGYLLSPMKHGIRLLTGAELALRDAPSHYAQIHGAEHEARRWYPLGPSLDETPWRGARPCLPDMKPVIGQIPQLPGLWLATGHGHQGFTLGPITGKLLAALVDGEQPWVDLAPFSPERFGNRAD